MNDYVVTANEKKIKRNFRELCRGIDEEILNNNFLYTGKNNLNLKSPTFNLINHSFGNKTQDNLKKVLIGDLYELESILPGSGDSLLEFFIDYNRNSNDYKNFDNFKKELVKHIEVIKKFEKSDIEKIVSEMESDTSKCISNEILNKASSETNIFIESSLQSENFIVKTDNIVFQVEFDQNFLINEEWSSSKYNFIIIDGFIQEVSEIHHLLTQASENKEDYVIFCKGASDDVKNTIYVNLKRKTINVFPIILKVNEENVNILNDIAACLGANIVSALQGDTISQRVNQKLDIGNNIKINKNSFVLKCTEKNYLDRQKLFLKRKITNINADDPNFPYLTKRIKNLESKKLTIKIREKENKVVLKELDRFLKYFKNGKNGIVVFKESFKYKRKIYTLNELSIIFKKLKSMIMTCESIGFMINLEK